MQALFRTGLFQPAAPPDSFFPGRNVWFVILDLVMLSKFMYGNLAPFLEISLCSRLGMDEKERSGKWKREKCIFIRPTLMYPYQQTQSYRVAMFSSALEVGLQFSLGVITTLQPPNDVHVRLNFSLHGSGSLLSMPLNSCKSRTITYAVSVRANCSRRQIEDEHASHHNNLGHEEKDRKRFTHDQCKSLGRH